jgi:hypothetical protein
MAGSTVVAACYGGARIFRCGAGGSCGDRVPPADGDPSCMIAGTWVRWEGTRPGLKLHHTCGLGSTRTTLDVYRVVTKVQNKKQKVE